MSKKSKFIVHDLIIIGAGPAGITAGIYAGRRSLSGLILAKNTGGQITTVPRIENYPGRDNVAGINLVQDFKKQAEKYGFKIKAGEVLKIKKSKAKSRYFIIYAKSGEQYKSLSVILAFGKTPRTLDVKGEKEFEGKGVAYCANCDMPFFRGKDIAVIGGGNSAIDAAIYGSDIAKKVYLIHRRDEFRAEDILIKRAKSKKNIEIITDTVVTEIDGDNLVSKIKIKNSKTNKQRELKLQGVFIEIGFEVKRDFIQGLVGLDEYGQVIIDPYCATSLAGIFAAGDITNTPYKQIVIATGEGAKAALSAYKYIQELEGKRGIKVDWGGK